MYGPACRKSQELEFMFAFAAGYQSFVDALVGAVS
jgi:hypothetical protein